ncbi:MAG TPA: isoprenylcysteine carboxylmethyltransferase family protein [Candidatus Angelobacter sp.]
MTLDARTIVSYLWFATGVVWLVGAFTAKRTSRRQSPGSRLVQLTIAVAAFTIGFDKRFEVGLLARSFLTGSRAVIFAGVAATFAGLCIAVWARFRLGGNWSGTVTLKENHTLIRKGPYSMVRHPIYSGILLALLGTAFVFREVRNLVTLGLVLVMLLLKIRTEEQFMLEQFGAEYKEYSQKVKALIPFVY